ncbi:hypothetical protein CC80DRAFT_492437 [Byssothecium circinans]|uniref:Uncharacterized protein n=1 Tax=Byssothecium circinans TaxID=147558 RepID=A0A6A5TWY9_9PLEO|nr:hypothetical protein CC80DRAFT_492437 [Byssothecium circinans]
MSVRQKAARLTTSTSFTKHFTFNQPLKYSQRFSSTNGENSQKEKDGAPTSTKTSTEQQPKKKTQAELDKELQMRMQGLAGDGGESGIEYEDGQPVSMKRSVKNNMFRYI